MYSQVKWSLHSLYWIQSSFFAKTPWSAPSDIINESVTSLYVLSDPSYIEQSESITPQQIERLFKVMED